MCALKFLFSSSIPKSYALLSSTESPASLERPGTGFGMGFLSAGCTLVVKLPVVRGAESEPGSFLVVGEFLDTYWGQRDLGSHLSFVIFWLSGLEKIMQPCWASVSSYVKG